MKSKVKKEIKQCFSELAPLVPKEGKEAFDRLDRLFGEARQEMSLLSSELESSKQSASHLKSKNDQLSDSLGTSNNELRAVKDELKRERVILKNKSKELDTLIGIGQTLIKTLIPQENGKVFYEKPSKRKLSNRVVEMLNQNPNMRNIVGFLVVIAVVDLLKHDGAPGEVLLRSYDQFNLLTTAMKTEENCISVYVRTHDDSLFSIVPDRENFIDATYLISN